MPRNQKINRRDFLNGTALSLAGAMCPAELLWANSPTRSYYPPSLTGMRGSHPGSFEIAHSVAWAGQKFPTPKQQTDSTYDLIVVGGGISGLSAAWLYQQRVGKQVNVLILDNHDDFGGHAKRNEFTVNGTRLIGYGGSQTMEQPSAYSPVSKKLLRDIAIDIDQFHTYFDREYFSNRKLDTGVYFSREVYGKDVLAKNALGGLSAPANGQSLEAVVADYPISSQARVALLALLKLDRDILAEIPIVKKIELMRQTSCTQFLQDHLQVPKEVTDLFRDQIKGYWGVGWDALSALEGYRLNVPGVSAVNLGDFDEGGTEEPYIHHFPDGNAGIARALVKKLIPQAIPGTTMEDLVTARIDYEHLDHSHNSIRMRLNSTVVSLKHSQNRKFVDVTYIADGKALRSKAQHVVYAGYNNLLPHICSETPKKQREAIRYATKVPLVYINIALRNWRAFSNLGIQNVVIPRPTLMHSFGLDFPVSMGSYQYSQNPDEPVLVHGAYVPTVPDSGMSSREQHVAGRRRLFEMSFADFETNIIRQMEGALSDGGFNSATDIAAITVNRWPHGYAYEYNELYDNPHFNPDHGPHIAGRAQLGRISIANSDASAYAYVDGAIDAADRAVTEQIQKSE